jgi:hypothetical protein
MCAMRIVELELTGAALRISRENVAKVGQPNRLENPFISDMARRYWVTESRRFDTV